MQVLKNVFTTTLMILSMVSADIEDVETPQPKSIYGKMLQSLIDLNERRVQSMNNLYQLDEYSLGKVLRAAESDVDASTREASAEDDFAVLLVNNNKVRMHDRENQDPNEIEMVEIKSNPYISIDFATIPLVTSNKRPVDRDRSQEDSNEDSEPIDSEELFKHNITREQANMLRKDWRSSCDKKAAKVCRSACRQAFENACHVYSCTKQLRRELKRQCKSACKAQFVWN